MVVIGFSNRVVRTVGSGGCGGRGTGEGQKHLVERWAAQADVVDGDASIGEHPYGLGQALGSVDHRYGNAAARLVDPRHLHTERRHHAHSTPELVGPTNPDLDAVATGETLQL